MRMGRASLMGLALVALAGCDVPGLLMAEPPTGTAAATAVVDPFAAPARVFDWDARPGAQAYQVVASLDRAGTAIAAVSAFTSAVTMPLTALSWREGHPSAGRSYFWVVRAYDRADPQGLLLATSDPREFWTRATDAIPWRVSGPNLPR